MEKIKNIYNNKTDLINIIIISLLILIASILFYGNFNGILTDKGRELLFPAAMLDGNVLYKDILCIYFPLAFQINAIGYKLFGISVQTIEFFGLINAIISCSVLYLISRQFIDKNTSLLLSSAVALASTFNGTLFNLQLPYSFSFTYGISAYLISLLLLIKYLKSDNIKLLPFSYLMAGFALACKSEFLILTIILFTVTFFIKPCGFKKNILNILSFLTFPVISFGILFLQGLTVNELICAFSFMGKFFTTDSMLYHISRTGGIFRVENFHLYSETVPKILTLYIISFILFKLTQKSRFIILAIILSAVAANFTNVGMNTVLLPLIVLFFALYKIKSLYENKPAFILVTAALALNIRMFWSLLLSIYGIYTAPILILAFIVLLFEYMPNLKYLSKEELKQFVIYMLSVYLIFFTAFNIWQQKRNDTPLITSRGELNLPKKKAEAIDYAIKYIEQYTTPEQKILVLPEGMAINYFSKRSLDYKLPMADRLYYDAIGENKIIESIKNSSYEVIIIVQGYGLTNFGKPYLYNEKNPVMKYIEENYVLDWQIQYFDKADKSDINIMKCFVKPY